MAGTMSGELVEIGEPDIDLLDARDDQEMRGAGSGGSDRGGVDARSVEEARVGRLLKEAKLFTEGVCFEAVVKEIRLGRFGEFVPPPRDERFRESWERRKDRMAYLFVLETPYGRFTDILVISAHPNSRMVKLARCYDTIKVGMKVKVCIENGKPKISC